MSLDELEKLAKEDLELARVKKEENTTIEEEGNELEEVLTNELNYNYLL